MRIFIDSDFRCHVTDEAGTFTPVETDFFDGKCDGYIEGFRYVPEGEIWVREDGREFPGEMAAPHRPYGELDDAQRAYERGLIAEYEAALREIENVLGVEA